jgi:hypothetical protein
MQTPVQQKHVLALKLFYFFRHRSEMLMETIGQRKVYTTTATYGYKDG